MSLALGLLLIDSFWNLVLIRIILFFISVNRSTVIKIRLLLNIIVMIFPDLKWIGSMCLHAWSIIQSQVQSQMAVWLTTFINPSYSDGKALAGFGPGLNIGSGSWYELQNRGSWSGSLKSIWLSSFPNSLISLRAIFCFLLLLFLFCTAPRAVWAHLEEHTMLTLIKWGVSPDCLI